MRKIIGNKKGIDTILAALLMVVIVVVASVMVYAWSTGLLGTLLVQPNVGKEAMNSEFAGFSNGTSLTLNLRNSGSVAISLSSYYVKDATGNQYARTTWSTGPAPASGSIAPNGLGVVYLTIGTQCGASCTNTGTSFTYTAGYSYTVVVVTSRNNQFSFTVTR